MQLSPKDRFYEFMIDIDADGTSRRLVVRIFTALVLSLVLFKAFNLPNSNIIWLILGTINNMIALGHAPKKNLFLYYLLSISTLGGMIILGSYFNQDYKYFIGAVGCIAFLSGMLGIFGINGKVIGSLGFVHYAIAASVGITIHHDLTDFLITYGIVVFSVFIVMFIAIPIPREKIIEGAKKKYYKLLKEVLLGHVSIDAAKTREMLLGIKEGLCDKLPLDCEMIIQKFIRFRNTIFMLDSYRSNTGFDNHELQQITKLMDELSLAFALVLNAFVHKKDVKRQYGLFSAKKSEIEHKILVLKKEKRDVFTQREIVHLAAASHILNEAELLLLSEIKS